MFIFLYFLLDVHRLLLASTLGVVDFSVTDNKQLPVNHYLAIYVCVCVYVFQFSGLVSIRDLGIVVETIMQSIFISQI